MNLKDYDDIDFYEEEDEVAEEPVYSEPSGKKKKK